MKMYYFLDKEKVRHGPFPFEELVAYDIQPNTLVWTKGMEKWQKAEDIPEIAASMSLGKEANSTINVDEVKTPSSTTSLAESSNNQLEDADQKSLNCGNVPAKVCPQCGQKLSGGEKFCPSCGYYFQSPQHSQPQQEQPKEAQITIDWSGKWMPTDYKIEFALNYDTIDISFKEGFYETYNVEPGNIDVEVNYYWLICDEFSFYAEAGRHYTIDMEYRRSIGCFRYTVTDDRGCVICEKDYNATLKYLSRLNPFAYIMNLFE